MVRVFCTLMEAAETLGITPTRLDAMISEGTLREFRDGPNRFLKVADVEALERQPRRKPRPEPAIRSQTAGLSAPSTSAATVADPVANEIRLPRAAAAIATSQRAPAPQRSRPVARRPVQPHVVVSGESQPVARPDPVRHPPCAAPAPTPAVRRRRPKSQTRPMSLKQWMWTGLTDDRPLTLICLLIGLLAGIGTLVGAAYFLTQAL